MCVCSATLIIAVIKKIKGLTEKYGMFKAPWLTGVSAYHTQPWSFPLCSTHQRGVQTNMNPVTAALANHEGPDSGEGELWQALF